MLGTSDEDLLYRLGTYCLNALPPIRLNIHKKRYGVPGTGRPGVLKYCQTEHAPLLDESEEFIPRTQWDLNGLVGETEYQLMHPDYYRGINEVFKHHKRKHDILTIFQCTSKKPYNTTRPWKSGFVQWFDKFSDFACISNPGIIPFEWSAHYPFRWDEWNVQAEKRLKPIIDMTHKYRIVNSCRMLRYKRVMGYKYIITYVPNMMKNWIFDNAIIHNIDGAREWCKVSVTPELTDQLVARYPHMKRGMVASRIPALDSPHMSYANALRSCVAPERRPELEQAIRAKVDACRSTTRKDSIIDISAHEYPYVADGTYQVLETLPYKEIKDRFIESLATADGQYLYKTKYWTRLDILLLGLNNNLIEDIDGRYWDLKKELAADEDFVRINKFLYGYRPVMGDTTIKEILDEACALKLIKDDTDPVLKI